MAQKELIEALESVLVAELRAYQTLDALTRDEKVALTNGDIQQLVRLTDRKEALLDELGKLNDTRRMLTQELGQAFNLPQPTLSLAQILLMLDAGTAERLARLGKGILALVDRIRDLTHSNHILARVGLERVDALQVFLLNLYSTPTGYGPPGAHQAAQPYVSWEIDQVA